MLDEAIKKMNEVGTLILEESDDSEKYDDEEWVRGLIEKRRDAFKVMTLKNRPFLNITFYS